ncbi:MAG: hypothetical protein ABMA01_08385 [Chthoniobacteraceae bacterium]
MPEAPITPEGRRAAEKVRTIFLLIAALNIVIIAILLWNQWTAKEDPQPPLVPAESRDSKSLR